MNIIGGLTSFARGVVNILLPGQPGTAIFPISNVSTKPVTTPGVYTQSVSAMPDRVPSLETLTSPFRIEEVATSKINLGASKYSINPKVDLSTGANTNQPSAWQQFFTELTPGLKQIIALGAGYGISKIAQSTKNVSPEQVYVPSAPYPLSSLSSEAVTLENNPFSQWIKNAAAEIMQPAIEKGIGTGIQGTVSAQMGVPVYVWIIGGGLLLFMMLRRR